MIRRQLRHRPRLRGPNIRRRAISVMPVKAHLILPVVRPDRLGVSFTGGARG